MTTGLAMILSTSDAPISVDDVLRELASSWPELAPATDAGGDDATFSFALKDANVVVARMPAPVPGSDLDGPIATSILWPAAAEEVPCHTAHWIATVMGPLEPIAVATRLTQVTAATMAACPSAIGVFWSSASLLVPRQLFLDFAREILPHPPLHVWIDYRVGKDESGRSGGFTTGMQALGHMEIEAEKTPETPAALRERLEALTGYLLENGPVIRDGDTIGEDAQERIRVIYSDSAFGHEGKVMRLSYEAASPSKPWWKLW